jgi:hypothetical protein
MLRMNGSVGIIGCLVWMGILCIPLAAQRQAAPVNSSAAPVPAPILEGKKAFISFELGDVSAFPSVYSGGPERAYNEFYQGMQQWGRYQLVSDPKDADVIFSIRFVESPGMAYPQIRLGISSSGGRVSLWGFTEEINGAIRKKNRDAAFTETIAQIIDDVKLLIGLNGTAPPTTQTKN